MKLQSKVRGMLLAAAVMALASACGQPQTINVTEDEYSLKLSQTSASPGDVTFTVTNSGHEAHELVVFKTDLPADGLPIITNDDGTTMVDESSPDLTHMTPEVEDLLAGGTKSATLKLDAGKYVVTCNVPDHYKSGMYAALSVK